LLATPDEEKPRELLLHPEAAREVMRRDVFHEPYTIVGAIELPAVAPHGMGVYG
jgi:hypothetical protein